MAVSLIMVVEKWARVEIPPLKTLEDKAIGNNVRPIENVSVTDLNLVDVGPSPFQNIGGPSTSLRPCRELPHPSRTKAESIGIWRYLGFSQHHFVNRSTTAAYAKVDIDFSGDAAAHVYNVESTLHCKTVTGNNLEIKIFNRKMGGQNVLKIVELSLVCVGGPFGLPCDPIGGLGLLRGLLRKFLCLSDLFSKLRDLFLVQTDKLVSLFSGRLHFSKLSTHRAELLTRVMGVTSVRDGDCCGKKDQKYVPVGSSSPRLPQSSFYAHFVLLLAVAFRWLRRCTLIWASVFCPRAILIMVLAIACLRSFIFAHAAFDCVLNS